MKNLHESLMTWCDMTWDDFNDMYCGDGGKARRPVFVELRDFRSAIENASIEDIHICGYDIVKVESRIGIWSNTRTKSFKKVIELINEENIK